MVVTASCGGGGVAEAFCFQFVVRRPAHERRSWGLRLARMRAPETLRVTAVRAQGLVGDKNRRLASAEPLWTQQLHVGDLLRTVNGHDCVSEMISEVTQASVLHIRVERRPYQDSCPQHFLLYDGDDHDDHDDGDGCSTQLGEASPRGEPGAAWQPMDGDASASTSGGPSFSPQPSPPSSELSGGSTAGRAGCSDAAVGYTAGPFAAAVVAPAAASLAAPTLLVPTMPLPALPAPTQVASALASVQAAPSETLVATAQAAPVWVSAEAQAQAHASAAEVGPPAAAELEVSRAALRPTDAGGAFEALTDYNPRNSGLGTREPEEGYLRLIKGETIRVQQNSGQLGAANNLFVHYVFGFNLDDDEGWLPSQLLSPMP
mmetsp:Transcript_168064/g.539690  ORF Transcript_168064/g.539690 Transcript_168064/m.539690 type:complete len:375 (-) Transcript_168064:50-1174(-)|eukprot:CAMPEP_0203862434 /NCGR_PEP_ID=MMETSP0359-20131031/13583_1 /ASSEMBLY_ACC=CAM_ASM_000338 /TAXON_ID=268821 /ORGANISM="Scrippsiella Hangoei, Strain SHTV-5" /LENGTH=374 /DNA_ID=CAMNT_0050779815 /DNA_START=61 /DNA_END=1185 /DNA_ORIENTATION=+